jgi:hypothetical protein
VALDSLCECLPQLQAGSLTLEQPGPGENS